MCFRVVLETFTQDIMSQHNLWVSSMISR